MIDDLIVVPILGVVENVIYGAGFTAKRPLDCPNVNLAKVLKRSSAVSITAPQSKRHKDSHNLRST